MKELNKEIIETAKQIAQSQGYRLDSKSVVRAEQWNIQRVKRIIFPCVRIGDNPDLPEKVLLKFRPAFSAISKEQFVANETSSRALNTELDKVQIRVQKTLRVQFDNAPEWIIREFLLGDPIGVFSINKHVDEYQFFNYLNSLRGKLDRLLPTIDLTILNKYHWQEKLQQEYQGLRSFLVGKIDDTLLTSLDKIQGERVTEEHVSLLHGDLAPPNILSKGIEFIAIDWGETSVGPAIVDWITVWATAVYQPRLREMILERLLKDNAKDPHSAKILILKVASRMLAKFAESAGYYQESKEEEADFRDEAIETFPLVKQNFEELLQQLD